MLKTNLKYTFAILAISLLTKGTQAIEKDSSHVAVITAGVDLAPFARPYIIDGFNGFAASADVEFVKNIIFTSEFGYSRFNIEKPLYKYTSKGMFYKLGFDINVLQENQQKNQVTLGLRYAWSPIEHELSSLTVNSYWGTDVIEFDAEKVQSRWYEIIGGIRMELFANIYLGWTMRAAFSPNNINATYLPLYVPGYNKNKDKVRFGFTYSIYYKLFVNK